MGNKFKRLVNNPWAYTIVGGIVVITVPQWILKIDFISILKTVAIFLWHLIVAFLFFDFKVSIWMILVAIIVLVALLLIKKSIIKSTIKEEQPPTWINYKKDKIHGLLFVWEYKETDNNKMNITNLKAVCEKCLCDLDTTYAFTNQFQCPDCQTPYTYSGNDIQDVEGIIIGRINSDRFANTLNLEK